VLFFLAESFLNTGSGLVPNLFFPLLNGKQGSEETPLSLKLKLEDKLRTSCKDSCVFPGEESSRSLLASLT